MNASGHGAHHRHRPVLRRRDPEQRTGSGSRSTTPSASRRAPSRPSCRGPSAAARHLTPSCAPGGDELHAHRHAAPDRAHAADQHAASCPRPRSTAPATPNDLHGRLPAQRLPQRAPGAGTRASTRFCAYHNTGTYGASKHPAHLRRADGRVHRPLRATAAAATPRRSTTRRPRLPRARRGGHRRRTSASTLQADYAAPAGWGDNNNQCGEIADICDDGGTGDTITVSGRTWVVQELWSNKQGKCTSTGPAVAGLHRDDGHRLPPLLLRRRRPRLQRGHAGLRDDSANVLFGGVRAVHGDEQQLPGRRHLPAVGDALAGRHLPGAARPPTTCPAGDDCGTIPDGCGGTVNCGTLHGARRPAAAARRRPQRVRLHAAHRPARPATTAGRSPTAAAA